MADVQLNYDLYDLRCEFHEGVLSIITRDNNKKFPSTVEHQQTRQKICEFMCEAAVEATMLTGDPNRIGHLDVLQRKWGYDCENNQMFRKSDYIADKEVYDIARESLKKFVDQRRLQAVTAG